MRIVGKIVEYDPAKQFGFIKNADTQQGGECFFHMSDVKGTSEVIVGDYVEYEVDKERRRAINIVLEDKSGDDLWGEM